MSWIRRLISAPADHKGLSRSRRSLTGEERSTLAILSGAVVALVPHAGHLPVWLPVFCLGLWAWCGLSIVRRAPLPGRLIQVALILAGAAAVLLTYGRLLGREPGVALFAAMLGLKPLEIKNRRDRTVTVFLCYFLTATLALFYQNLITALVMLVSLIYLTGVLIKVSNPSLDLFPALRRGGGLVVQSLPLAAVFFFLFPRLPGSLWGVPEQGSTAVSGLSETLSPGSISNLVLSGETAFRVSFQSETPEPASLYWRALVLWRFDGQTWRAREDAAGLSHEIDPLGESVDYTVTLEPHQKTMLPALDYPVTSPRGSVLMEGLVLKASRPVYKRVNYQVRSHPGVPADMLSDHEFSMALSVDPDTNPRAAALADSWNEEGLDPRETVARNLDFFRTQGFSYTLTPPLLGEHAPIDDFLFETRQGYCGHYASSFTWLMRAAGVPARVVVGYQGGTLNPVGDYHIVRQSDAHAWSEVWLPGQGWTRVDPTFAVAPQRINQGVASVVPQAGRLPLFGLGEGPFYETLKSLRFRFDALYNAWNQWVIYYDFSRQGSLFSRLGLGRNAWQGLSRAIMLAVGLFLAFMGVMGLVLMGRGKKERDRLRAWYDRFLDRLHRAGIEVRDTEGPLDLNRRVREVRRDLEEPVSRITGLYAELRYGAGVSGRDLDELEDMIRRFRPAPAPRKPVASGTGNM